MERPGRHGNSWETQTMITAARHATVTDDLGAWNAKKHGGCTSRALNQQPNIFCCHMLWRISETLFRYSDLSYRGTAPRSVD